MLLLLLLLLLLIIICSNVGSFFSMVILLKEWCTLLHRLQVSYCKTFHIMCDVPSTPVLYKELSACLVLLTHLPCDWQILWPQASTVEESILWHTYLNFYATAYIFHLLFSLLFYYIPTDGTAKSASELKSVSPK
jgi:hypothetical protein